MGRAIIRRRRLEKQLAGGTTGAPMTYMADGKQYIVVAVGWEGVPAELVAFTLP